MQVTADVNGTAIDSFAELLAAATDTGAGVHIALGAGNSLTLNGISQSQLQSDWFTFS